MREIKIKGVSTSETQSAGKLSLPNPQELNSRELRQLFIRISREFVNQLHEKNLRELREFQAYIRSVAFEIELKDKGSLRIF